MKPLLALIAAAGVMLPVAARAQSLGGDWDAGMNTPGGTINFGLSFTVHGDTVTGTVHRSAGDVPLYGTIRRDTVTFSYTVQYNGNDLTLTMTAKLAGDSLSGTVDFAGQGSDQFWATRAKRPPGGGPTTRPRRPA